MSITLGQHELLAYDGRHSVMICRECKYAIQKSALDSHLLRHKIYRGERRRLLSSITQMPLLEPDDVLLPPTGSPPVDILPVLSGYRCTAVDCGVLCASSKRMRRHWSEVHGLPDPPDSSALPVNLQTFFRGTKLRYFEVASSTDTLAERLDGVAGAPVSGSDSNTAVTPLPLAEAHAFSYVGGPDLDLDMLNYFHHFVTTTCLALPHKAQSTKHWQVDVVAEALLQKWLMYGLLTVSASHLCWLSDQETTAAVHLKQLTRFLQAFSAGWHEARLIPRVTGDKAMAMAAQMDCIRRCYFWTTKLPPPYLPLIYVPPPFELRSFAETVQGCVSPESTPQVTASDNGMPDEPLHQTRATSGGLPDGIPASVVPPALLEHFRTLPYRMSEVTAKPNNVLDFFATLSALEAVVECCSLGYANDDMEAAWTAMTSWLTKVSDHFKQMVWRRDPAALIVFAQWSFLVDRTERNCWFLTDSAFKLRDKVRDELPNDEAIQSLVQF